MISPNNLRFPRMTAIAAGLAMAFLGSDISVAAPPVINCNESGLGSLREAAMGASDGDTIDLMGLSCGRITLASGSIPVANNLTINGPAASVLTIDGGGAPARDRVFTHGGIGTLSINGLTVANGYLDEGSGNALGGCIYSAANVQLTNTVVSGCFARADNGGIDALGGGIFTKGAISLTRSTISGNTTVSSGDISHFSNGGGAYARNGFTAESSTLSNNTSQPLTSRYSKGGGAYIQSGAIAINSSIISSNHGGNGGGLCIGNSIGVMISNSSISGNQASKNGGGLFTNNVTTIINSTISGNQAYYGGGLFTIYSDTTISSSTISSNRSSAIGGGLIVFGNLSVFNSTIAFNTSDIPQTPQQLGAAGVAVVLGGNLTLSSTIIANNRAAGEASDLSNQDINGGMRISAFAGSNNLIVARNFGLTVPSDTSGLCPKLQRLANHGGSTQTLALRTGSPAIDNGIDGFSPPLTFDQRGMGFTRTFNAVDIGAYERQQGEQDDALFFSSFESGCDE